MSGPDVLITGFGPFPGVEWNPTGWLVQRLARTQHPSVTAAVLPVSWHSAWAGLEPLLEAARPRLVIHFGVSSEADGFCLERRAYNACSPLLDADGAAPDDSQVVPSPVASLDVTLPLKLICAAVASANIRVTRSDDPGRYLCNALLFRTLHWAQGTRTCAGFVHIPHIVESGVLPAAQALAGARLIIEAALHAETTTTVTA